MHLTVAMLLSDLVSATDRVAASRARTDKTEALADLLRSAGIDEMEAVVGLVSGAPRQGRIGVGWATVASLEVEPATAPSLTVADLDALLSELGSTSGSGSQERRLELLTNFLSLATSDEADFVRRLLVGELRQGANAGIVTDAVARATDVPATALRRAVMLSGDLGVAAETAAREGRPGLDAIGLELHRPIQPMLASSAASIDEAMADLGPASVEWKLDGIRVQIHRTGSVARAWTRNLHEITDSVPEVLDIVRGFDAEDLVLDGEILGVDESGAPLAFQDTASRDTALTPYFFDLLHHDGDDLLDAPLRERRGRLVVLAGDLAVPAATTSDAARATAVFDEAIAAGHEGVVIKGLESSYQAGRRGRAWRKVKPIHTLDLVVIAVEHGSGRRRGWLSNIHLGARDPSTGDLVMVGKTFKGMTDAMLEWQTSRFGELAIDDDGRVVTVRPEQVVEIALDGVQRSSRYPGGVALRFARVVRYREDKRPGEADTIEAVRSLL